MNEKNKIINNYLTDGYDQSGAKIPDFPILYLVLEKQSGKKLYGPAIIDTGFDGTIFANDTLAFFLSDIPKDDEKVIGGFGASEFTCELFKIQAHLSDNTQKIVKSLGEIPIFIPTDLNYLSEYVIIGRELLNNINFCLNGLKTTIFL